MAEEWPLGSTKTLKIHIKKSKFTWSLQITYRWKSDIPEEEVHLNQFYKIPSQYSFSIDQNTWLTSNAQKKILILM